MIQITRFNPQSTNICPNLDPTHFHKSSNPRVLLIYKVSKHNYKAIVKEKRKERDEISIGRILEEKTYTRQIEQTTWRPRARASICEPLDLWFFSAFFFWASIFCFPLVIFFIKHLHCVLSYWCLISSDFVFPVGLLCKWVFGENSVKFRSCCAKFFEWLNDNNHATT